MRGALAAAQAKQVEEFLGTSQNFNPLMAMAADYVVVEAEKLVKRGEIAPEQIHASGIFVDGIYLEK